MDTFNEKLEKVFKENKIPIIQYEELKKNKPAFAEGGFGKVFSGYYNNTKIALKQMKFDKFEDELINEILNEIKTLSIANEMTDQVPKFYGLWKGRKSVGLVLEFIEGKPLSKLSSSLTRKEKINIIVQLCQILKAIHSKNMIHRDLKPDNIIIGNGLKVTLIDFGLCRIAKRIITMTNKPKGTPHYYAPEAVDIVESGDSDEYAFNISTKADIWSVGVIISEIFSGVYPWSSLAKNQHHINSLIIQQIDFPIPSNIESDIKEIIQQCVNYQIDERPTAEEIIEQFSKIN